MLIICFVNRILQSAGVFPDKLLSVQIDAELARRSISRTGHQQQKIRTSVRIFLLLRICFVNRSLQSAGVFPNKLLLVQIDAELARRSISRTGHRSSVSLIEAFNLPSYFPVSFFWRRLMPSLLGGRSPVRVTDHPFRHENPSICRCISR